MIGPPGIPKIWTPRIRPGAHARTAAYVEMDCRPLLAGVLAHFSHHMAIDLPADQSIRARNRAESAPTSIFWPVDAIHTLIDRS